VLGVGNAISISFPPGPVDSLVLRSAAAQPSPIRARISTAGEGAGDHDDHMAMRIGVGLFRSFQAADDELPGGCAFGGRNPIQQRRPAAPTADSIDNLIG
jgi:hypothetical protein